MPPRPLASLIALALLGCEALSDGTGRETSVDPADALIDAGVEGGVQDAAPAPDGSLYPQVADILGRSCGYLRCHAGPVIGGGLDLTPGRDYRAALVEVESCEYDGMKLVEPGAPERSWLMIKLTAPFRPLTDPYAMTIFFDPPEGWEEGRRRCRDQTSDGQPLFGQRMPATAPNMLAEAELELLRSWIAMGAPP